MKIRNVLLVLALGVGLGLLGACEFGKVEQGRCVAFDADAKKMTLVLDVNHDQRNPHYSGGVVDYLLPDDPNEIGPLPVPGGRVMFDLEKGLVLLFNPETRAIEELAVEFVDKQMNVRPTDAAVKGRKFPVIDTEKQTVTEYSRRLESLVTFKVPSDKLHLPPDTWEAGDEIRLYYKENNKHQAQRVMNITRTNIFKR